MKVQTRGKLRGFSFLGKRKGINAEEEKRRHRGRREESAGKWEDEQVAFSGDDDGEGAAVGRNGEVSEA